MLKRIVVCILFLPALFGCLLWWPIEYLRFGKIDAMNTPIDKLARWAE